MAIFNQEYINEFFKFKKKENKKKEYHHLNRNEISRCISIAREYIKDYPKLKKACYFDNIYKKDPIYSKLDEYYKEDGGAELFIIWGDVHDGGYGDLDKNAPVFWDDCGHFYQNVIDKIKAENLPVYFGYTADWDDIGFFLQSEKEK